jgi:hypothetical protein
MALGFIKNILKKRKIDKQSHSTGQLMPHGSVQMQIPVTFTITQDEIDRFGWTPHEQMINNPRIRSALEKVI